MDTPGSPFRIPLPRCSDVPLPRRDLGCKDVRETPFPSCRFLHPWIHHWEPRLYCSQVVLRMVEARSYARESNGNHTRMVHNLFCKW